MTPKEKANELISKYYSEVSGMNLSFVSHLIEFPNGDSHFKTAKQCALIAADEIISVVPKYREWLESTLLLMEANLDNPNDFEKPKSKELEFWKSVKQEIEKL